MEPDPKGPIDGRRRPNLRRFAIRAYVLSMSMLASNPLLVLSLRLDALVGVQAVGFEPYRSPLKKVLLTVRLVSSADN
jgi:hypothetical protein